MLLSDLLSQLSNKINLECNDTDDLEINGLNTLSDADKTQLSFLENKKYILDLSETQAGAVFVHSDLKSKIPESVIGILCDEPYVALAYASQFFASPYILSEGKTAVIANTCQIQDNVHLGKNVVLGEHVIIMSGTYIGDNVKIGDNTVIYPNVSIYHSCVIGSDVIIHAGTVIGSDGFGFAISKVGKYVKIYQNGNVTIGNDVEIGANCAIDRAAFNSTVIGNQVRLDNLVHIAHNCILGDGTILAGQVGLAGSAKLGEKVVMGGQSGAVGHIEIASFTTIAGRGVATKTVNDSGHYAGFPLLPHRTWLKLQGRIQKLLK
ncbi:MAG: UDP-3-O-(3-hydroxymyristoyl)glucosamine N-acyltransferase [Gammaproteobacteria bacterium]|nr:UDP-3-O-(3-hydroxymyristoyl)glucosamine N-acyltransferase [Gammaproteobacteria bacterium]